MSKNKKCFGGSSVQPNQLEDRRGPFVPNLVRASGSGIVSRLTVNDRTFSFGFLPLYCPIVNRILLGGHGNPGDSSYFDYFRSKYDFAHPLVDRGSRVLLDCNHPHDR